MQIQNGVKAGKKLYLACKEICLLNYLLIHLAADECTSDCLRVPLTALILALDLVTDVLREHQIWTYL